MNNTIRFWACFLIAGALVACGDDGHHEDGHDEPEGDDHSEHAHASKHGGTPTELGAHEGFVYVKHDEKGGSVTIWIYLGEETVVTKPAEAPVLNLKTKDGPKSITATQMGDAWIFTDNALKGEPEGARFRIVVGGKTYSPEMAHDHDHDGDDHDGDDHDGDGHDGDDHEDHDDNDHDEKD